MDIRFRFPITICILLLTSMTLSAQEIKVSAAYWPNYSEQDGGGLYLQLLSEIYLEYELKFDVGSFARAKRQFNNNDSDILVGVYKENENELNMALFPQYQIHTDDPIVAIYNPKVNNVQSIDDLKHKTVGWFEGYSFEKYVPHSINKYTYKDLLTAFGLLKKGRIDAVIDYELNLRKKELELFKTFVLSPEKKLYLAFKNNKKGKKLLKKFEAEMPNLKSSGYLKKLYGDEYQEAKFSNIPNINNLP